MSRASKHLASPRQLYLARISKGAEPYGSYGSTHDVSGNCTGDVYRVHGGGGRGTYDNQPPREITYKVRCRRCDACLRANARHWAVRASRELEMAPRSWFWTLTFSAEKHWLFEQVADKRGKSIFDIEYGEVQKMFRAMRKQGFDARYMVATEAHQSGYPHFHILLHENLGTRYTVRDLAGNHHEGRKPRWWHHGLAHAKLVDKTPARAAWYVCKYISKDPSARQRASLKYGGGRKFSLENF